MSAHQGDPANGEWPAGELELAFSVLFCPPGLCGTIECDGCKVPCMHCDMPTPKLVA